MFATSLNDTIRMLVDHELNRDYPRTFNDDGIITKGIVIEVNLNAAYYDNSDKNYPSEHRSFYMLFHGNTSVYYANRKRDGRGYKSLDEIKPEEWVNTSNHDSCWKSDGFQFLTENYFDMCKKVNPDVAPIKINIYATLGFGLSWPVKQIIVTFKHRNSNRYGNKIIKVK